MVSKVSLTKIFPRKNYAIQLARRLQGANRLIGDRRRYRHGSRNLWSFRVNDDKHWLSNVVGAAIGIIMRKLVHHNSSFRREANQLGSIQPYYG